MDGAGLNPPPPLRIGLTGGIGSGKSTVAGMLYRLGAVLIDTDAISRRLTGAASAGGAALDAIKAAFGAESLASDGALDRHRMRDLVFTDASAKQRLEAILHPLIRAEADRQAAAAATTAAPAIVFDVPLLIESAHWLDRIDKVLVVDCSAATQLERVMQRPGWTLQAAQAVIAQQAPRAERLVHADAVILNDAISLARLDDEVQAVWQRWVQPAH